MEAKSSEAVPQPDSSALSKPSARSIIFADEDLSIHECTGCKDHGLCGNLPATLRDNTGYDIAADDEINNSIHEKMEMVLFFQSLLCKTGIAEFISLGARSLYCRTSSPVEDAHLYHRLIDEMPHLSAKRIDFPHKIALRKSSYRRIAAHTPYRIQ